MKRLAIFIVSLVTCAYFLCAGNITFFTKLGKGVITEICDLDKDANEKEEGKGKEDKADEDTFLSSEHMLMAGALNLDGQLAFCERNSFVEQPSRDKHSPPPKA